MTAARVEKVKRVGAVRVDEVQTAELHIDEPRLMVEPYRREQKSARMRPTPNVCGDVWHSMLAVSPRVRLGALVMLPSRAVHFPRHHALERRLGRAA